MLNLKQVSPSRFNTYDTCLFKYFLTYEDKTKLKSNYGAQNGSLIHHILEQYVLGDNEWLDKLYKGFAGELELVDKGEIIKFNSPLKLAKEKEFKLQIPDCNECKYFSYNSPDHPTPICEISREDLNKLSGCPKMLFNTSISLVQETINRYENIWPRVLKNNRNELIGVEYEYFIQIPGTETLMHGIMDLIVLDNEDTIHIYDYKAGIKTQDYNECKEDLQVKMYSLAARREFIDDINKKGYKFKNILLTFDYLRKSPITLAFSKEEDDKTEKLVQEKINKIKQTTIITRIVPENVNWEERGKNNSWKWWKCKFLCDTKTCSEKWKGEFKI